MRTEVGGVVGWGYGGREGAVRWAEKGYTRAIAGLADLAGAELAERRHQIS